MTTITCLGHGGAFSPQAVGNTAYLVESGGKRILVDCGTLVPETLKEMDIDPGSLDAVCITHPHADHWGGLERLLYHRHYGSKAEPIPLVMGFPEGYRAWDTCVSACANDLDRHVNSHVNQAKGENGVWGFVPFPEDLPGLRIDYFRVNRGGDIPNMVCFAFLFTLPDGSKVFFSGDRVWEHEDSEEVLAAMLGSDLAFHEIELSTNPSGAHTHYTHISAAQLGDANMKKIWWGHHGLLPGHLPSEDLGESVRLAYRGRAWSVEGGKFATLV